MLQEQVKLLKLEVENLRIHNNPNLHLNHKQKDNENKELIEKDNYIQLLKTEKQEVIENNKKLSEKININYNIMTSLKEQIKRLETKINDNDETIFKNKINKLNLENEQLREININLQEENESYQLLLQEKTLNGEFILKSITNQSRDDDELINEQRFNLASELDNLDNSNNIKTLNSSRTKMTKEQQEENKRLIEENKALTLYIQKILTKIMSNPVLAEAISSNGDNLSSKRNSKINNVKSIKHKPSANSLRGKTIYGLDTSELKNEKKQLVSSPLTTKEEVETKKDTSNNKTSFFNLLSPITPTKLGFQFSQNKKDNLNLQEIEEGNNHKPKSSSISSPYLPGETLNEDVNDTVQHNANISKKHTKTSIPDINNQNLLEESNKNPSKGLNTHFRSKSVLLHNKNNSNNEKQSQGSYISFKNALKKMGAAFK